MNAEERLAYLLESVFVPTNATITVAAIVEAVGSLDAGRLVVGTIQSGAAQDPILAASYQALSTVGMSLSGADRQGLIDQLAIAGNWPDAVRDAVKALGGAWRARWQIEGYATEPTLESITAEINAEAMASQKQDWQTRFDAILNQIGTVEQADGVAALRGLADEMESV
jgi:hypothetical protein